MVTQEVPPPAFEAFAKDIRARYHYKLPFDVLGKNIACIPVSGGKDSSALALVMTALFPSVEWIYLFTDTLADDPAIYETLDALEAFTGRRITRLTPDNGGLEGLIHAWNGFLPGGQARWCTRELKLVPFEHYVRPFAEAGYTIYSLVGILADEDRTGLVSHDHRVLTITPFRCMGVDRSAVFAILEKSIGIPSLYRTRSRSGCY